jgi:flagellar protein FliS
MNATVRNAVDAYQHVGVDVSVRTASPHRLILLLFDGAIKAVGNAQFHMNARNIAEKGLAITKAIAIIDEGLRLSLDVKAGGELAEDLSALYEYMCHRLMQANLKNDAHILEEVNGLLAGLREAWASIEKDPAVVGRREPEPAVERPSVATSYGKV